MAPPPPSQKALQDRILALAKTLQFAWFIGHVTLTLCAIRYAFSLLRFNFYGGMAQFTYRTAFIAAAITYGLVVYKLVKARVMSDKRAPSGIMRLLADENVQYLGMALVWTVSPQYPIALAPYAIYSVFHILVYSQNQIIPTIQPLKVIDPPAGSSTGVKPQYAPNPMAEKIRAFVKQYYEVFMTVVSSLEILLWVRLFFAAVMFQRRSWLLLLIYTAFLRSRFSQSTHIQASFAQLEARVDSLVGAQGTPPVARQIWEAVKGGARQFYTGTDINKYMKETAVPKKAT